MILWYIDKSHDLQTSFVFFRISKSFEHTFVAMFPKQDVEIFFSFHGISFQTGLNKINIIFKFILFYYLNQL
jgi:hypothetical protein